MRVKKEIKKKNTFDRVDYFSTHPFNSIGSQNFDSLNVSFRDQQSYRNPSLSRTRRASKYNSMIGPSQRMLRLKFSSNINYGKPSVLSPSDMNKHLNSASSFNNSNYGRVTSSLNNSMAVNKLKAHQNKRDLNSPLCHHTKMADFKYSAPVHHDPNDYL